MDLKALLAAEHAEAAHIYLARQRIEEQRQQLAAQAMQADRALIASDGKIALLEQLIAQEGAQ